MLNDVVKRFETARENNESFTLKVETPWMEMETEIQGCDICETDDPNTVAIEKDGIRIVIPGNAIVTGDGDRNSIEFNNYGIVWYSFEFH